MTMLARLRGSSGCVKRKAAEYLDARVNQGPEPPEALEPVEDTASVEESSPDTSPPMQLLHISGAAMAFKPYRILYLMEIRIDKNTIEYHTLSIYIYLYISL